MSALIFQRTHPRYKKYFSDPVVIIDPANHENNVASRITEKEKSEIIAKALQAWKLLTTSVEDDNDV